MTRDIDSFKGHPYPINLPLLQFKPSKQSESSFKVMVITDTHLLDDQTVPGNASNVAIASRNAVRTYVSQEQPDFVVHLGDLISGEAANNTKDVQNAIREILSPMKDKRIPFSTTKGNHDNDKYSTHGRITDIERNYAPSLSYTRKAPKNVGGGEYGTDNYWVPIFPSGFVDPNKVPPKVLLWFFDSRAGRKMLSQGSGPVDDWVDDSVADWINSETEKMEKAWGHVPPGLIFVHIPVHEHYTTQNDSPYSDHVGGVPDETPANYTNKGLQYEGLNDDKPLASQGQENDQCEYKFISNINLTLINSYFPPSDIYAGQDRSFLNAFMESKAGKAYIHGIVSGHDHGNDWCAPSSLKSSVGQIVPVCFAKHSGYGGYDYDNWNHGARIFQFNEENVQSGVETYVRFETGEKRYSTNLNSKWATEVPA
ncbi:hypothetical protein L7F22_019885 [Adiantum nelumboides]|nr:hypothetical protein [Adiantum nelumboides]